MPNESGGTQGAVETRVGHKEPRESRGPHPARPRRTQRHDPRQGAALNATPRLLSHGYWGYRDPEQTIRDMFGADVSRRFGFADALAAEDQGSPGQVLRWAGWVQMPPPVRAIVGMACAEVGITGYFDEVEVARATCPVDDAAPRSVTLYARRRNGRIRFRLSGGGAVTPDSVGSPLGPEEVHALLCGTPEEAVSRWVARILRLYDSPPPDGQAALLARRDEWLPCATSRFYDFAPVEDGIRRAVPERVLLHHGFEPPWP
jgi:hypothetical protein